MIDTIMNNATTFYGTIVALAGGVFTIIKCKNAIMERFHEWWSFKREMRSCITETQSDIKTFLGQYEIDSARWDIAAENISLVKNKIENGLSHQVAMSAEVQRMFIEVNEIPLFLCNEHGDNLAVSRGYLGIIGVESAEVMDSTRWKDAITGEQVDSYLKSFADAVKHARDFVSSVGLRNPFTDEPRGLWRISATCTQVGEALAFIGRFSPVDDVANRIAVENNWKTEN